MPEGNTSFNASLKSTLFTSICSKSSGSIVSDSKSILGKYLLNADIAASRQTAEISAPTNPWVICANSFNEIFLSSGILRVCI